MRVHEDTKRKLEKLKREDETWDEFLDRLANKQRSMTPGAWEGTDKVDSQAVLLTSSVYEIHVNWRTMILQGNAC
ncbi:hypothetical protein G3I44_04085 [Halogeometricum borinquense]|uniref:Uncharacterized protein n=1 Tax=Halogeometricum borinquense TaxID=60847 RepID=A0A6C0UP85_9EURY|nr:hypothetical protein [Halogeometricum borinquense]QIB76393.1 hypothetical protein G3I44_04085 [Halogeometricum borinquense]